MLALLLTGLLIEPIAAMAGYAGCLAKPYDCSPAPSALPCCCVTVAEAEQLSLTPVIVAVNRPAAGGAGTGCLMAMPPQIVFAQPSASASSPPIDRLALFSQLLI
jgi:hypothetical protein